MRWIYLINSRPRDVPMEKSKTHLLAGATVKRCVSREAARVASRLAFTLAYISPCVNFLFFMEKMIYDY